ncbi:ABC transporter ATP-binding protein [Sinorhizobium meliloti]|uniref:ABC transporter ATP-binding protein n=1 Tax=Rhizobium meliloti TaxID=382 RepID=UPI000419DCFA|nr:ABC transporter ATP-binding protein [Sinorhizobium meliloti]MDE3878720.1 ABC transporter ATP-binding protein [Sinorhizobium meliloti]MDE4604597.1 ABC transporter ATP-binding protein [Sinorhizobium meliloti]MDX0315679.1 ATP-binding cassette domain-containing protein [Sinorhizobium meliloti]RVH03945.1 ABC transporter ATP-binding protein [Sinorhizobium meliloti]UDU21157.1 ABC transporter ATP-binding protein [Sinorhizobium meliloti]
MTKPVLEITGLDVTFPGLVKDMRILRGVDLQIQAGEILGLVGESGSGKSMTASACLGMVPAPARVNGSILIDGEEVVGRSDADLNRMRGCKVAMVFQNPMRSLNPFFTIGQQLIEIIRRHRSCGKREAQVAAVEGLQSVQIPDANAMLARYPHQLSGGQIQRVMIALALACRPKVLIADEPTTALDVTVQAQIISLLYRLAKDAGLTILFITHDLGVVSQLCDRVAVMYEGEIVETGSVSDIIDNPAHPYSKRLIEAFPAVGRKQEEFRAQEEPACGPNITMGGAL